MKRTVRLGLGLALALLAGCAQPDRVLFVTGTQIDLGYDVSLGTLNIGYDRNELVIGPAGPSTFAYIASDIGIVQTSVKQLYATGDAAASLTRKPEECSQQERPASARVMVFGTATHFGLKAHFVEQAPDMVSLGFKRKEFSLLPVEKSGAVGSVLAGLDLNSAMGMPTKGGVGVKQVIATGAAADCLAKDAAIQTNFKAAAKAATEAAAGR